MPIKMPELLREGERPPRFDLKDIKRGGRATELKSFLGERRIVLLFLGSAPAASGNGRAWLEAASQAGGEISERGMTVLAVVGGPDAVPEPQKLPDSFAVLHDERGAVTARYGGAPAFYLVGKDGTIKRAARHCPPLRTLFGQIDAMPMRRREMRGR